MLHQSQLSLTHSDVHLWVLDINAVHDQELLNQYAGILSKEEKERWQRFKFAKHRHQFLVSHALVRHVLSRYALIAPDEWEFSQNSFGRPEVMMPPNSPNLRFNLSHTDGLAALAVTLGQDIGVDVESADRINASPGIANRFFSPFEVEALFKQPDHEQKQRLFEYWTLKESFIKAKGMGLSFPLNEFSMHLNEYQDIRVSFSPKQTESPDTWRFWQLRSFAHFLIALCVNTDEGSIDHQLQVRNVIPCVFEELVNNPS